MHESILAETPYCVSKNGITTDTMHFLTPRFDRIAVWHCIDCHKKYDKRHATSVRVMLYPGVIKVFSARTGYCPSCALSHADDISPDRIALGMLPLTRDVYEHWSGDTGRNKFGEVVETYGSGDRVSYCL